MKIKCTLGIICLFTLYHLALISNLVPATFSWGGNMERNSTFYIAEIAAITINIFLIWILLKKGKHISNKVSDKFITITLWGFVILFSLNTIGNLLSTTWIEKSFSIFTATLAMLLISIIKSSKKSTT
jgi:hypothetical protein